MMNTARGARRQITVRYGFLQAWLLAGLRIPMVSGATSGHGDGLGLTHIPGDSRLSTMVAGYGGTVVGVGRPDRMGIVRGTLQRLSAGGVARDGELASALVSVSVEVSAGAHWASANRSSPGTMRARSTSAISTFGIRGSPTSTASRITISTMAASRCTDGMAWECRVLPRRTML